MAKLRNSNIEILNDKLSKSMLDIYNIKSVSLNNYLINYSVDHAKRNNNSSLVNKIIRDFQLCATIYNTIDNYKFFEYLEYLNINTIDLYNSFKVPSELEIELSVLVKISVELSNTYSFDKIKEIIEFITKNVEDEFDLKIFVLSCVLNLYKFMNSEQCYLLKKSTEQKFLISEDIVDLLIFNVKSIPIMDVVINKNYISIHQDMFDHLSAEEIDDIYEKERASGNEEGDSKNISDLYNSVIPVLTEDVGVIDKIEDLLEEIKNSFGDVEKIEKEFDIADENFYKFSFKNNFYFSANKKRDSEYLKKINQILMLTKLDFQITYEECMRWEEEQDGGSVDIPQYFYATIPFLDKELIFLYNNNLLKDEIQDYFFTWMKVFYRSMIYETKIYEERIASFNILKRTGLKKKAKVISFYKENKDKYLNILKSESDHFALSSIFYGGSFENDNIIDDIFEKLGTYYSMELLINESVGINEINDYTAQILFKYTDEYIDYILTILNDSSLAQRKLVEICKLIFLNSNEDLNHLIKEIYNKQLVKFTGETEEEKIIKDQVEIDKNFYELLFENPEAFI